MPEISRPQLAVYVAAALAIALLGARYLSGSRPGASAPARAPAASTSSSPVRVEAAGGGLATVQVVGAVRRPGVYRLPASRRVDDAVREAGGATRRADLAGVNLAAKLSDGQQIIVPAKGAAGAGAASAAGGSGTSAAPVGAAGRGGGAGVAPAGPPLNLNTATPEQLDQLDGIGPTMARKIVLYRQQHGGFRSVAELDQVPGIGEKRLAELKDRVRV